MARGDLLDRPLYHRWPWWVIEALAAVGAGVVAYIPLHQVKGGIALAITAAATVAYVGLTNEIRALSRRQVLALHAQVSQQQQALHDARSQAAIEMKAAQDAAVTAKRTVEESVRARYDASAPRVAIQVLPTFVYCELKDSLGQMVLVKPAGLHGESPSSRP